MISFSSQVTVPESVLFRELEGESVLLNLETESYLGLDEVGTRMWTVLTSTPSIEAAYEILVGEYAVDPDTLHRDIETLLKQLLEHKLVALEGI